MTDSDVMLHEANRRAHRVARAASTYIEKQRVNGGDAQARFALVKAVNSYKEIERRQIEEATA